MKPSTCASYHTPLRRKYRCVKTLNFEQMGQVNGGDAYSAICGGLFTGWGLVLGYATMAMGPVGWGINAAWSLIGLGVCNMDSIMGD